MRRLENKVAVITGAARGQGRSHAVRLAQEGADIIAIDICAQIETVGYSMPTEEDLAQTAKLVQAEGRRVVARRADVREYEELEAAVAEGIQELGRLDVVVANAGIGGYGPVHELTGMAWRDMIDTNLTGVWHTCKAAVPQLLAQGEGGSIVITSSAAGLHALAGIGHYNAAKHGLVGLMRTLAIELGPNMIRANSIHPTQVNTPMLLNEHVLKLFCPDAAEPTVADFAPVSQAMHVLPIPWVEPIDISNAVVFLASDESRYVTGVALPVDAGADLIA